MTGKEIVDVARTYIGTPWHHAARVKGVGIDCSGLLIMVSQDLGIPVEDELSYTENDEIELMTSGILKHCRQLGEEETSQDGDLFVFRQLPIMYNHCGIFVEPNAMVHAWRTSGVNKVVESRLDEAWTNRVLARYRYKEVKTSRL